MVSNFGIASLWRGSSPMIGAVPVQNALLMMGYGAGKRWSEGSSPSIGTSSSDNNESNILLGVFIGGCTGGVLQSFIMSPVELVKVMQQVTNATAATANVVASGIFSLAGTWKGLGATLLRDGIPHGVWFASYEYAKTELGNYRIEKNGGLKLENDIATPMLSGAFAATTAWAVGYPFDLIKTRIQAGSGTGIFATATMLIDEAGGMHGLYKGFTLKLLRSIPASAIGFLTYETAAKYLSAK
jgi:solute carrier family 25 carnitine/acylcarnitine transporter 20/29